MWRILYMNKLMTKITMFAFLVLATTICNNADSTGSTSSPQAGTEQVSQTQPEKATITPVNDKKVEVVAADVGRDDPFGGGFGDADSDVTGTDSVEVKLPLFVRTITLKFLSAANLKNALVKMSSANGSISIDENTNSIIVCDTKENLERMLTEIRKADQTPKQVIIEVFIIDVQLNNDTEIGVDWDILSKGNKDFSYRQSTIYPNRMSVIRADSRYTRRYERI